MCLYLAPTLIGSTTLCQATKPTFFGGMSCSIIQIPRTWRSGQAFWFRSRWPHYFDPECRSVMPKQMITGCAIPPMGQYKPSPRNSQRTLAVDALLLRPLRRCPRRRLLPISACQLVSFQDRSYSGLAVPRSFISSISQVSHGQIGCTYMRTSHSHHSTYFGGIVH